MRRKRSFVTGDCFDARDPADGGAHVRAHRREPDDVRGGDRDLERRRELSSDWLAKARAALAADAIGRRVEALQSAGRALALDPDSSEAAGLFAHPIQAWRLRQLLPVSAVPS